MAKLLSCFLKGQSGACAVRKRPLTNRRKTGCKSELFPKSFLRFSVPVRPLRRPSVPQTALSPAFFGVLSPGSFNGEANKPFFPNKKPHAEVPAARKRTTCKNKKDKLHSILSKTQIRIFRQYHVTVIGNTVQL